MLDETAELVGHSVEDVDVDPQPIRYINLSPEPLGKALGMLPYSLQDHDRRPKSVVFLPDLSPKREGLPTGCCVELDKRTHPDWRALTLGDVGCGMQVVRSELSADEFRSQRKLWDSIARNLQQNKGRLGDLGSGNHFIDAAVDDQGQVYFIVHTGSRDQAKKLDRLVEEPEKFDSVYNDAVAWARSNRDAIIEVIENRYGRTETILDRAHDYFIDLEDRVLIFSGASGIRPNDLHVIPSSMTGGIAIVKGRGGSLREEAHYAVSHGTGRWAPRGSANLLIEPSMITQARRLVYVPPLISDQSIKQEHPDLYRDLSSTLTLLRDHVEVERILRPIAYIGQLPN